ncbi:flagellar hook-length control protein FliK [Bosea sp. (in: a-proteobacteria)]|uniref:flagellar hook-length control protein FliK n=1 Tax=Bosea sp. (in: a-proteobacteria) TaxID=1871050 RepID=UPI003341EE8A
MPAETVFNTSSAKGATPPWRRSAEARAAGEGEGFALPEGRTAAQEADQGASGSGRPPAVARTQATGRAQPLAQAAGQVAAGGKATPATAAQPGSAIDALAELLAAAQAQAMQPEGAAGAQDEAGRKQRGGEAAGTAEAKDAAKDAAPAEGEAASLAAISTLVSQAIAAVLTPALPMPTSTEGGQAVEDFVAKGRAASAATAGRAPLPPGTAFALRADGGGQGEPRSGEAADGAMPGTSALGASGGQAPAAGQGHKAGKAEADPAAASPKGEAAQGGAAPAASSAAAETRTAEAAQQALAPIDLATLVQQAAGGAEPARLLAPLDQPPAGTALAAAPGPGQAALPPTPLHVLPVEIGLRALAGAKQFDIRLDPEELGRVDVNLSISDKGEVSARLVVDRVETLHLLQRDARTLERAFEQAGLKPSDGGVEISLRDPSDQSAFRQQRQHEEAPRHPQAPAAAEVEDDTVLPINSASQRRLVRLGGVDLSI